MVFRLRCLKDGRDFASMGVINEQMEVRVVSRFVALPDRGAWHPSLDRPEDGAFSLNDLRIRYELRGEGVSGRRLEGDRFLLSAGSRAVLIEPQPGLFAGEPIQFELLERPGFVAVDLICYRGTEMSVSFDPPPEINIECSATLRDSAPGAGG
ncbi:hypothetical protein Pan189_09520 [Stratiformator vulcanicus]|uniref:Uncharacterized protein n=1 Tax=Stratiformator vulcanicus TaxID=2527980 RepID=A0A517QY68_9PLAN|nr:hypothetical protein Pan189_09520 [Stratiformator vulcanicus]